MSIEQFAYQEKQTRHIVQSALYELEHNTAIGRYNVKQIEKLIDEPKYVIKLVPIGEAGFMTQKTGAAKGEE